METIPASEGFDLAALGPWYAAEHVRLVLDGKAHRAGCRTALERGGVPTRATGWHWAKAPSHHCASCFGAVRREAGTGLTEARDVSAVARRLGDYERDAHLPAPPALVGGLDVWWRGTLGDDPRFDPVRPVFEELVARRARLHDQWASSGGPEDLLGLLAVKGLLGDRWPTCLDDLVLSQEVPRRSAELLEVAGPARGLLEGALTELDQRSGTRLVWLEEPPRRSFHRLWYAPLTAYRVGPRAWELPARLLPVLEHLADDDSAWRTRVELDVTGVGAEVVETAARLLADGGLTPERALELAGELV